MAPEVAKAQKLTDLVYLCGWCCVLDCLQFVSAWQDTLFCESETKVGDFFTAEEAFLQVDFDALLDQALQNLVQSSDVFWVRGGMYQQGINVHDYIGESVDHSFHQALKLAGHPSKPMGLVTHWNWPIPGTVKAVYGRAWGCKIICQKPAVRSMVLKIVLPDWPILPMHSLTSFIEYLFL
jgi:hypothetical protein